jgi:hypothetical protein
MSYRVTTETEMRDKALFVQACRTANVSFTEVRHGTIRFTSGKLANATLDLRTGRITGDSDYSHTESGLGTLRLAYAEARYRADCDRAGITIESRTVDREGNVILMCSEGSTSTTKGEEVEGQKVIVTKKAPPSAVDEALASRIADLVVEKLRGIAPLPVRLKAAEPRRGKGRRPQ